MVSSTVFMACLCQTCYFIRFMHIHRFWSKIENHIKTSISKNVDRLFKLRQFQLGFFATGTKNMALQWRAVSERWRGIKSGGV